MPRAPSTEPQRQRHQQRQRKYRARLRETGQPEADAVDAALAAAVCALAAEDKAAVEAAVVEDPVVEDPVRKAVLSELVKRARRILVAKGGDRDEVTKVLHRRLLRGELERAHGVTLG